MKKISIIIPVFNTKPEYLNIALDSAIGQTHNNIEIIVVNDGSTNPETLSYLNTVKYKNVKVIHQENKGPGGARNTGIEHATGEYIGFLDSDDWISPNFYEELLSLCIKNKSEIACGTLTRVENNKFIPMDNFGEFSTEDFAKKFKYITNGSISSKLFNKNLFKKIKFVENVYFEDNFILTQLLIESKKVSFTYKVKYFYRKNINSICLNKNNIDKITKDSLFLLKKLSELIKNEKETHKNIIYKTFLPILINGDELEKNIKYQNEIIDLLGTKYLKILSNVTNNSFIENIFSIKNSIGKTHKIITVLGIKLKIQKIKINNFKNIKFSIIIPTLQLNLEILNMLLKELENDNNVVEIILIDNTGKGIDNLSNKIKIIKTKENLYVNQAWNLGVRLAKSDYIGILNDDIVLPLNFINDTKKFFFKNKKIGFIGLDTIKNNEFNSSTYPIDTKIKLKNITNRNLAWGTAIFFKKENYINIPEEMKIWCGDDFLFDNALQNNKKNYCIINSNIIHLHSLTSNSKEFDEIKINDINFYQNINPKFEKNNNHLNFFQKIFSITDSKFKNYKIITILGFSIYKSYKLQ